MDQQLNYFNRFFLDKNDKSKAFWDKDFHKLLQSKDNFTLNNENCICLFKKGKILNKIIPRYYSIQGSYLLYGDNEIKGFRKLENVYMKTQQINGHYAYQIQLTYNVQTLNLFSNNESDFYQFKQKLEQFCILIDFHNQYTIINQIGFGSTAYVFVCRSLINNEYYAIKRIRKNQKINPNFLMEEISIMHELEHPNILKLYKVFETNKHINMVLELVEGGELLKRQRYNLKDARTIFKQLLQCVDYMHQKGIMHRDLKPQNILCKTHSLDIILADFGLATWIKAKNHFYYRCGTTGYVAPEILQFKEGSTKMYSEKCDIFSLGVILYQLVYNVHPFKDPDKKILLKKNLQVEYKFDENNKIPISCKDLISLMLKINPKQRPSAAELLKHDFFNETLLEQSNVNLTLSQQDSYSEQKRSGPSLSFHHAEIKFSTLNLGFKAYFEDEVDDKKEINSSNLKELSPLWSKRIGFQRQVSQRSQASSVVIQRQQSQDLKKPKTSIFRSELKYQSLQILSPFEIHNSEEINLEVHQIPYVNQNNMLLHRIKS